jgi:hypothetical protein
MWMLAGHSPLLALVAWIVWFPGAPGAEPQDSALSAPATLSSVSPRDSLGWSAASQPPHSAAVRQFTPWKHRRKAVLEQTYKWVDQQSDAGSAIVPDRLIAFAPIESHRNSLAPLPPLRC